MRKTLDTWISDTDDKGQYKETPESYKLNMDTYFPGRSKEDSLTLRRNIATMLKWAEEGR